MKSRSKSHKTKFKFTTGMPKRRTNQKRDYQRSDRLNELLREVLAQELDRISDTELGLVSITSVQVDNELTKAKVYLSSLDEEEQLVHKVSRHKGKFRKAIGDQARIRRVPELEFILDPSISASTRIDEILANIHAAEKSNNHDADDN